MSIDDLSLRKARIAVVIPAYKVSDHIIDVVETIPSYVQNVVVVDDGCPEGSGKMVQKKVKAKRVKVLFHSTNQGVGGAVISGYQWLLRETDAQIIVKVDGDGQMDPNQLTNLVAPIIRGHADYSKGNRFDSLEDLEQMPRIRILGNAVLSILSKFSTGYWNITDPTNGFIAVHRNTLSRVKLEKIRKDYFFESDLLFRLALIRAVVVDVPMPSKYGPEKSNLKIRRVISEFPLRHAVNFGKRIFYNYYLREWNIASFELPVGLLLFIFGITFGATSWLSSSAAGIAATTGQVMLSAVPIILGTQLLLAFLNFDISSIPRKPLNNN